MEEFHFNEDILYQEYNNEFSEQGGNEKLGKWYGWASNNGYGMWSLILTEDDELITSSNMCQAIT